jgi:sesquipedalian
MFKRDMKFQKRWFVLKGNLLFYFEKKGDKEPLGLLLLEGCKRDNAKNCHEVYDFWVFIYESGTVELSETEESQQYCFELVYHGENDRKYYMGASHQNEMEGWMKSLTTVSFYIPSRGLVHLAELYWF